MRPAERIDKLMTTLLMIWKLQPDTRFNQLIHNLQYEYSQEKDFLHSETVYRKQEHMYGTYFGEHKINDLFSVEDDDFQMFLNKKYSEYSNKL